MPYRIATLDEDDRWTVHDPVPDDNPAGQLHDLCAEAIAVAEARGEVISDYAKRLGVLQHQVAKLRADCQRLVDRNAALQRELDEMRRVYHDAVRVAEQAEEVVDHITDKDQRADDSLRRLRELVEDSYRRTPDDSNEPEGGI